MNERLDEEFRAHIAQTDKPLSALVSRMSPVHLPKPRPPFESLVRIVVGQQLSVAAAQTVHQRVVQALGFEVTPCRILACDAQTLRNAGLSRAKVASVQALAAFAGPEGMHLNNLVGQPWGEIRSQLLDVRGIGPWSCDMFAMFGLALPDVFAPGDYGLRQAMDRHLDIPTSTTPGALEARALRWSPYRTLACLYLWKSLD